MVNLGDTLSRITNYKLKTNKHRVLDIGVELYSNPFCLDPKYSSTSIRINQLIHLVDNHNDYLNIIN